MKAKQKWLTILTIFILIMIASLIIPAYADYKTLNATKFLISTELGNVVAYDYVWNGSPCHIVLGTGVECI